MKNLEKWKNKKDRKPLIIRGARQTGKTVAIEIFAKNFENPVTLNLERDSDKSLFERSRSADEAIKAIELYKGKTLSEKNTLLFIDEIQNSQNAIKFLRFFHEDRPDLFVIAAGSLLEAIMIQDGFSFPVGRVEFLYLHPLTFDEFLLASGKNKISEELLKITPAEKPSAILHKLASEAFNEYALVGGMPAVVADFIEKKSFQSAADIKENLLTAIKDDVAKYARVAESKYLRHVIEYAPYYLGERVTYEKFGNSEYRSREIKRSFELLEYAMVVQRVHGSYSTEPPIQPNFSVAPKLLYLDSGLAVHKLGLTQEAALTQDLNALFKGKLAEQIVGQSLMARNPHQQIKPCFWYRNKPGSTAEIDFSCQHQNKILPIEVKSGKTGGLKSLHQFMLASPSDLAVRFYSGELATDILKADKKTFKLLSVPFYLQWRLGELLEAL